MNLLLNTYKTALLQTSCGNSHGVKIKAKPLFLIALIEAIGKGIIIGNKLCFIPEQFEHLYISLCKELEPSKKHTPIQLPFFHLNKEPYYTIKFRNGIVPPKQALSPSRKYLRENVEYSYLDPNLWDLLRDPIVREELKQNIIDWFILNK